VNDGGPSVFEWESDFFADNFDDDDDDDDDRIPERYDPVTMPDGKL
jgi:hypothetical protein